MSLNLITHKYIHTQKIVTENGSINNHQQVAYKNELANDAGHDKNYVKVEKPTESIVVRNNANQSSLIDIYC
jgi:hypothetical protein